MTLDVYAHVFDEFDPAERVSAEAEIQRARESDLSVLCLPGPGDPSDASEIAANDYVPSCLPRISFMIPEDGRGGHAGSRADKNPLQMRLFEQGGDDQA
jgi:hypothetical protein